MGHEPVPCSSTPTSSARTFDQQQWKHAFGLTALTTRIDPNSPGEITGFYTYKWFYGRAARRPRTIGVERAGTAWFYRTLQEVGPNLTNDTFRDACSGASRYTVA